MRSKVSYNGSKSLFKATSAKTNAMNIVRYLPRGGYRL